MTLLFIQTWETGAWAGTAETRTASGKTLYLSLSFSVFVCVLIAVLTSDQWAYACADVDSRSHALSILPHGRGPGALPISHLFSVAGIPA